MPEKEPVKSPDAEDADPIAAKLKELGIEEKDAQSPGARRCAQMLLNAEGEVDRLARKSAKRFREWNIGTNGGKGYDTEMMG